MSRSPPASPAAAASSAASAAPVVMDRSCGLWMKTLPAEVPHVRHGSRPLYLVGWGGVGWWGW